VLADVLSAEETLRTISVTQPTNEAASHPLNNRNLSELFWMLLGQPLEGMPWYFRELPGLLLVVIYMAACRPLLAKTVLRSSSSRWLCAVFPAGEPDSVSWRHCRSKWLLRWTLNLKYIVNIPEFFFNI